MVSTSQNLEDFSLPVFSAEPGFAGLDVQQLAAAGFFQAIAYWLNEPLIPQNVYAQVLADEMPGRLKVLVEFERSPQPQRLMGFICDRLYQLNSNVIEGVYIVARAIGSGKTDWQQRIRIPTARQRQARPTEVPTGDSPVANSSAETITVSAASPQLLHESSRSKVARNVVRSQFKFFRAAFISGAATAAFLFGGLTELILSDRLALPTVQQASSPAEQDIIPWYGDIPEATEVALRTATSTQDRGRTVEAALETVAVIPHNDLSQPEDPTITLVFGGELGLNDFVFEEAESLDELFSDLSIYQQADVAMVGLAEPLATPSTTLQEDFYHRTRPEAVQSLKKGGIDIVNLASEGTLTYGTRGLSETIKTLDREGIYRVGAGRNQQEAHRPEILEVKGQRIAYLGYNPEALKAAKDDKAGVALTSSKERLHILEDIRAIRPQVDWVVVNYRWGDILGNYPEKTSTSPLATIPEDWQQSLAHDAVDAGADLVVGYHPSQIQGAEIYRDRAIAYSLGDFVFGEAPLEDHDTAALRVSLRNQKMKVEFLPVSVRNSQIQMATGDRGEAILKGIRNASETFDQPLRFPAVLRATPSFTRSAPTESLPTESLLTEPIPQPVQQPIPQPIQPAVPQPIEPPPVQPVIPIPDEQLPPLPESSDLEPQYEAPSPHPLTRESGALFMPDTPDPEQNDWRGPVQNPWRDDTLIDTSLDLSSDLSLEDWGEKPAESGSSQATKRTKKPALINE
ncbi:MAG: CapA family protein [Cyanobacteria bacterium J06554_11]